MSKERRGSFPRGRCNADLILSHQKATDERQYDVGSRAPAWDAPNVDRHLLSSGPVSGKVCGEGAMKIAVCGSLSGCSHDIDKI